MAWEKVKQSKGRRRLPGDIVSMHKSGRLGVSSIAIELGDGVDVWIDKEESLVALGPHGSMFKVSAQKRAFTISMIGVLCELGLTPEQACGHYEVTRGSAADGTFRDAFVIDLKNGKV